MTRAGLCALVLLLGACRGGTGEGPSVPAASTSRDKAVATPGEGVMCAEHGVLEAICTKCHPKLIAVFQAKGDWCGEHGFPESVCPLCHPERGGRPAPEIGAALAGKDAPVDGTAIRFKSPEITAKAGLEVATAAVAPSERGLVVNGRLAFDGTRVAEVGARVAGVVVTLAVDVGSAVVAGSPLATLRSADRDADRARLGPARAKLRIMRAQLDRKRALAAEGLTSEAEVLQAQADWELARSDLGALTAALAVVAGRDDGSWIVTAPFSGVVTERHVTVGNGVSAEQSLLTVVDASALWAELDVPEERLGEIAVGQSVSVAVDAITGRTFSGRIDYLAPSIDPHSRTALARVPLLNVDGALRAHMFVTATVALLPAKPAVAVPRAAIQRVNGEDLVFVVTGPGSFVTRRVQVVTSDGQSATLSDGIAVGESVVTTGSFLLKTEVLKDSIGAGCCEVD